MHIKHNNHLDINVHKKQKTLTKKLLVSVAIAGMLVCSGCSYHQKKPTEINKQEFYQKPTLNVPQTESRIIWLQKQNITVIHQGANWRFVLPVRHVFIGLTQKIQSQQIQSLKYIAAYIRENPHATIKVSGYSNSISHAKTAKQQSQQYAETIASYLWHYGVAWNTMTIRGFGNQNSVASNTTPAGTSANNRIEVTIKNYS